MNLTEIRTLELKIRRALAYATEAEHQCFGGDAETDAIKDRLTNAVRQMALALDEAKAMLGRTR